jgi:hypothetical protein
MDELPLIRTAAAGLELITQCRKVSALGYLLDMDERGKVASDATEKVIGAQLSTRPRRPKLPTSPSRQGSWRLRRASCPRMCW